MRGTPNSDAGKGNHIDHAAPGRLRSWTDAVEDDDTELARIEASSLTTPRAGAAAVGAESSCDAGCYPVSADIVRTPTTTGAALLSSRTPSCGLAATSATSARFAATTSSSDGSGSMPVTTERPLLQTQAASNPSTLRNGKHGLRRAPEPSSADGANAVPDGSLTDGPSLAPAVTRLSQQQASTDTTPDVHSEQSRVRADECFLGSVKSYNSARGWGHIRCQRTQAMLHRDVFFMRSALKGASVAVGNLVAFRVVMGIKGHQASDIALATSGQPAPPLEDGTRRRDGATLRASRELRQDRGADSHRQPTEVSPTRPASRSGWAPRLRWVAVCSS